MRLTTAEELQRLQCQFYRLVNGILSTAVIAVACWAIYKIVGVLL